MQINRTVHRDKFYHSNFDPTGAGNWHFGKGRDCNWKYSMLQLRDWRNSSSPFLQNNNNNNDNNQHHCVCIQNLNCQRDELLRWRIELKSFSEKFHKTNRICVYYNRWTLEFPQLTALE